jgi:hypothetical protein
VTPARRKSRGPWWVHLLAWGAILALAALVQATCFGDELAVAPAPAADPLAATTTADGWATTTRTWLLGEDPRDLIGARVSAQLGLGHFGLAARGETAGVPGTFVSGKVETVKVVNAALALHWNAARLPAGIIIGPAVAGGASVAIETRDGQKPSLARSFSALAGVRVSGPGFWVYAGAGIYQPLRGLAGIVSYSVRVTGAEEGKAGEISNVGEVACGAGTCSASTGIAVRLWGKR